VTSGLRIGSPVVTTRGFKEKECTLLAGWIADILDVLDDEAKLEEKIEEVKSQVIALCAEFPVYR
jgi:glycine hydroxymethyltransferase